MNGRIVQLGPRGHKAIQALLPWYVSDALDEDEAAHVRAHLEECAQCRAELAAEHEFRRAYIAPAAAGDVEAGLAVMHARIAAQGARPAASPPPPPRSRVADRPRSPFWVRWTLIAQFGVIVCLLTVVVLGPLVREPMHALGALESASGANCVVRFSPDATEREIRQALVESGARIVGGPTVTAAYMVRVPPAESDAAIARLRAQPGVVLAESLGTPGKP